MNIKTLEKMSTAIYIAVEDSIANDISDGIKWAINRIKELETKNDELKRQLNILARASSILERNKWMEGK